MTSCDGLYYEQDQIPLAKARRVGSRGALDQDLFLIVSEMTDN